MLDQFRFVILHKMKCLAEFKTKLNSDVVYNDKVWPNPLLISKIMNSWTNFVKIP